VSDPEFPDIFADGVTVSTGPYGVALTFYLSDPLGGPGGSPGRTVGRVRVSLRLAEDLSDNIKHGLSTVPDKPLVRGDEE
jgi:hypothetical protein